MADDLTLTPEQEALVPQWLERYWKYATETAAADKPLATEGIRELYATLDRPAPPMLWVYSPVSAALLLALIADTESWTAFDAALDTEMGARLPGGLDNYPRDRVAAAQRWELGHEVSLAMRRQLGDDTPDRYGEEAPADEVDRQLRDVAGTIIREKLPALIDRLRDRETAQSLGQYLGACFYGQHEFWTCYYTFCRDVVGDTYSDRCRKQLDAWNKIVAACGWFVVLEDWALVCQRPVIQHLDSRGELECDYEPAIAFADGWTVWRTQNVDVTEQIIMHPETLTVQQIRSESSEEVRRLMIDRKGRRNFLTEAGAVLRDERRNDRDAMDEKLWYVAEDNRCWFECFDPSTGRQYFLPIRPVQTCAEAQLQLSHGLDAAAVHRS